MPEVTRGLAAHLWSLSGAAKEDCVLLAHALPAEVAPVVLSSPERKAQETASVIALRRGLEVCIDDRVAEVDRPQIWDEDYREVAARYLAGADLPGWEPRELAVRRVGAVVDRAAGVAADGNSVVVTHGLAMSLWLASVAAIDVVPFWRALTLPDAWRWDARSGLLTHLFDKGLPPE